MQTEADQQSGLISAFETFVISQIPGRDMQLGSPFDTIRRFLSCVRAETVSIARYGSGTGLDSRNPFRDWDHGLVGAVLSDLQRRAHGL